MEKLTKEQQYIYDQLYDLLMSFKFASPDRRDAAIMSIINEIESIINEGVKK